MKIVAGRLRPRSLPDGKPAAITPTLGVDCATGAFLRNRQLYHSRTKASVHQKPLKSFFSNLWVFRNLLEEIGQMSRAEVCLSPRLRP